MQMNKSTIISGYISFYETFDGRAALVKWTEQPYQIGYQIPSK